MVYSPSGLICPARDQTDLFLSRAIGILRRLEGNRASQDLRIQYKLAAPAIG
jgi:hypothetical protein